MHEFDTQGFRTLSRKAQRRQRQRAEVEAIQSVVEMRSDQRAIALTMMPQAHRRAVQDIIHFGQTAKRRDPRRAVCEFLPRMGSACVVNDYIYAATTNLNPDTTRGQSGVIWSSCPWESLKSQGGNYFEEDFQGIGNATMSSAFAGSVGRFSAYGYAGAQVNDAQLEGGVVKLSSDGDNEGLALLSSAGSFRFITTSTLAYNRKMWFEARVARSSIVTAHMEFFVGLMKPTLSSGLPAAAQPITTTDDTLMTAGDLFGFHCNGATATRGGPTEVAVAFVLASGTVNYPTNLTTLMASTGNTVLAADTYVKLGFVFDPNARATYVTTATARQTAGNIRKPLIKFYVNNVIAPTFLASDDVSNATSGQAFPTAFMAPVIAMMNQASFSSDYLAADWLRVGQAANS